MGAIVYFNIDGKPVPRREVQVYDDIEVDNSFDSTSSLEFTLKEAEDIFISASRYAIGRTVDMFIDYRGTPVQVFHGTIIENERDYPNEDIPAVSIVCYDASYKLKRKLQERVIVSNGTLKQNVIDIVKSSGINNLVIHPIWKVPQAMEDRQSITFGKGEQDNTAWKALQRVANTFGQRLFVHNDTLFMVDDKYMRDSQQAFLRFVYGVGRLDLDDKDVLIELLHINTSVIDVRGDTTLKLWTEEDIKEKERNIERTEKLDFMLKVVLRESEPPPDATSVNIQPVDLGAGNPTWDVPAYIKEYRESKVTAPDIIEKFERDLSEKYQDIDYYKKARGGFSVAQADKTGTKDTVQILTDVLPHNIINNPEGVFNMEQLSAALQGEKENNKRKMSNASCNIGGNPLVQKGQQHELYIKALGDYADIDSGKYTVESVTHKINSDEGYTTRVKFTRPLSLLHAAVGEFFSE